MSHAGVFCASFLVVVLLLFCISIVLFSFFVISSFSTLRLDTGGGLLPGERFNGFLKVKQMARCPSSGEELSAWFSACAVIHLGPAVFKANIIVS